MRGSRYLCRVRVLSLPVQPFRQAVEVLAAVGGYDDQVLDADAAEVAAIEAGLDGHDVAEQQFAGL